MQSIAGGGSRPLGRSRPPPTTDVCNSTTQKPTVIFLPVRDAVREIGEEFLYWY